MQTRKSMSPLFLLAIFGLLVSILVFTSCDSKYEERVRAAAEKEHERYKNKMQDQNEEIHELVADMEEIEANLSMIRAKEQVVYSFSSQESMNESTRDRIFMDLQVIDEVLEENRKKIAALERKIRNSGIELTALKKEFAALKLSAEAKDLEIAALHEAIRDKEEELEKLDLLVLNQSAEILSQEETIIDQEKTIEVQDAALNEVYVAIGTKKELEEKGILQKEGGFLGIGAKKVFNPQGNSEGFTKIDRREWDTFALGSKKAELLTPHPESSFDLSSDREEGISELEIQDPQAFWEHSKYLVIELN